MPQEHEPEFGDLDWLQSQLGDDKAEGAGTSGGAPAEGAGPAASVPPAAVVPAAPAPAPSVRAPLVPAPSVVSPPASPAATHGPPAPAVWGPGQVAVPRDAQSSATPVVPVESVAAPVVPAPPVSDSTSVTQLEPEPWWTTVAQVPLVLTAEEVAASGGAPVQPAEVPSATIAAPPFRTSRFGRRLPGIPAAAVEPREMSPEPAATPGLEASLPAVQAASEAAPEAEPEVETEIAADTGLRVSTGNAAQAETSAFTRLLAGSSSDNASSADAGVSSSEPEVADEAAPPRPDSGPFGLTPETAAPRTKVWPERKAAPSVPTVAAPSPTRSAAVAAPAAAAVPAAAKSLFGHGSAPAGPPAPPAGPPVGASAGGGAKSPASQKTRFLVLIAVGLVAVLILVGLFFIGQGIGGTPVAATTPTSAPTPTPTPTPTQEPDVTAPQGAGVHAWNTMFGTECLAPFMSPWEEEFTVVDCETPHTAQLVSRGTFSDDPAAAFPGEEALAAQINLQCTVPGIIDMTAAGAFPDLQLQGSYPVTDEQWSSGQRYYYCFVSRSSGEPLTGSLAGPGPTV